MRIPSSHIHAIAIVLLALLCFVGRAEATGSGPKTITFFAPATASNYVHVYIHIGTCSSVTGATTCHETMVSKIEMPETPNPPSYSEILGSHWLMLDYTSTPVPSGGQIGVTIEYSTTEDSCWKTIQWVSLNNSSPPTYNILPPANPAGSIGQCLPWQ